MRTTCFVAKVSLFSFSILVLTSATVSAQDEEVTKVKTRIDTFFQNVDDEADEKKRKAFADLLARGPLQGHDNVKKLIDKMETFEGKYGKFVEAEAVHHKQVGKDLVLLKYLYKMEKYPVVWYFTYYRPPSLTGDEKDWVVIAVRFDTRLDLLGL